MSLYCLSLIFCTQHSEEPITEVYITNEIYLVEAESLGEAKEMGRQIGVDMSMDDSVTISSRPGRISFLGTRSAEKTSHRFFFDENSSANPLPIHSSLYKVDSPESIHRLALGQRIEVTLCGN